MAVMNAWIRASALILAVLASLAQCSRGDAFQSTLGHIKPRTSLEVQANAAQDVAIRLLGEQRASLFVMSVNPKLKIAGKDTFKVSKNQLGQIEIQGTSGVACTWGLHYYLKNFCNAHVAWEGVQVDLPHTLPDVRVKITSNDRFRYYQNVCTVGYSSVWWQWAQWEKHIDWMALNGINLALAFNGQEAIWERVYRNLNLTQDEIDAHFGGPAFLPWSRMGNIRGFGGPLSPSWHNYTIYLQHRILQRMRNLGIIPVLPAFAGHVPRAFSRIFHNANMTKTGTWNKFKDKYCCPYLLQPTEELFQDIGRLFLKAYIAEFGTDHVYNCDIFNENEPESSELSYLKSFGQSVFASMNSVDPQAIWLMQGWLFVHDLTFWTKPRAQSLLTSVPIGRMIVLDLQSEQFPQYGRLKSYFGQPFIWCMLHNFGGTLGMFGSAQIVNQRVFEARSMNGSTMIGTGLTPEGINQNYVIYELMNEMSYRREPVNLDAWFQNYATRRYGAWNEYAAAAWRSFGRTVYNFIGTERIRGQYVITKRPSLKIVPWTWYSRKAFFSAWEMLLKARHGRKDSPLYRHDVVDVTRQALQLKADDLYKDMIKAYNKKDINVFQAKSDGLVDLYDDLELILATGENFLLGRWLRDAKSMATNEIEEGIYEFNARNQITLWGPNGEIRDYANKQWSGVVADYFLRRWSVFSDAMNDSIIQNKSLNISEMNDRMFREVEEPFCASRKLYPTEPKGDSIKIALSLFTKWNPSRASP